jgi:hypothetical protein
MFTKQSNVLITFRYNLEGTIHSSGSCWQINIMSYRLIPSGEKKIQDGKEGVDILIN